MIRGRASPGQSNFGAVELSAVIITQDEEANIVRCITSLADVVDEVIVVDSGSSDGTVQLARELGAAVTHRPWTNYSDQKNFANSLAKGGFILSVDADEALSPALREAIIQARRQGLSGAYSLARMTNYCGSWIRHGGWYPDTKVRLFPKEKARWEGAFVHETLQLDGDVAVAPLKGDLLHYSYGSISDHIRQVDLFTTIGAQGLFERGKRPGAVKLFLSPVAKFIGDYLFRGGFLDGWQGFVIARISAHATFLKYAKLRQLWQQKT